jgi:hypothetical protein
VIRSAITGPKAINCITLKSVGLARTNKSRRAPATVMSLPTAWRESSHPIASLRADLVGHRMIAQDVLLSETKFRIGARPEKERRVCKGVGGGLARLSFRLETRSPKYVRVHSD